jgi:hypothetical protein
MLELAIVVRATRCVPVLALYLATHKGPVGLPSVYAPYPSVPSVAFRSIERPPYCTCGQSVLPVDHDLHPNATQSLLIPNFFERTHFGHRFCCTHRRRCSIIEAQGLVDLAVVPDILPPAILPMIPVV